ncbi:Hypothetical protein UVM_LOCUS333 [uncultured virus]|nr:Hypothetical protein UVM_LOCUS333 [uncultured virus]
MNSLDENIRRRIGESLDWRSLRSFACTQPCTAALAREPGVRAAAQRTTVLTNWHWGAAVGSRVLEPLTSEAYVAGTTIGDRPVLAVLEGAGQRSRLRVLAGGLRPLADELLPWPKWFSSLCTIRSSGDLALVVCTHPATHECFGPGCSVHKFTVDEGLTRLKLSVCGPDSPTRSPAFSCVSARLDRLFCVHAWSDTGMSSWDLHTGALERVYLKGVYVDEVVDGPREHTLLSKTREVKNVCDTTALFLVDRRASDRVKLVPGGQHYVEGANTISTNGDSLFAAAGCGSLGLVCVWDLRNTSRPLHDLAQHPRTKMRCPSKIRNLNNMTFVQAGVSSDGAWQCVCAMQTLCEWKTTLERFDLGSGRLCGSMVFAGLCKNARNSVVICDPYTFVHFADVGWISYDFLSDRAPRE